VQNTDIQLCKGSANWDQKCKCYHTNRKTFLPSVNLHGTSHSQFTYSSLFIRAMLEFRTRKAHGTHRFTLTQLQYSLVAPLLCSAAYVTTVNISELLFLFFNFYYNQQMQNCITKLYITTVSLCNINSHIFRNFSHVTIRQFTTKTLLSYTRTSNSSC
jgi:hypothetical protein